MRILLLCLCSFLINTTLLECADNTKVLIGTWAGKATGPQGGPPTGELTIRFERGQTGIIGTALVKGSGTLQYSGVLSDIALNNKKVFSAVAVFKLGEIPLEVRISGPLKGKTIAGTFIVINAKGETMGEGAFAITKSGSDQVKSK